MRLATFETGVVGTGYLRVFADSWATCACALATPAAAPPPADAALEAPLEADVPIEVLGADELELDPELEELLQAASPSAAAASRATPERRLVRRRAPDLTRRSVGAIGDGAVAMERDLL
ncbi:MAG TPA: hypothetical protein VMI11_09515 [Actinomycetes bacterium]|nr:hypothetical protein [Actinomycetes bacterium]